MRPIDADALKDKISNIKLRVKSPEMVAGFVEAKAAALREIENAQTETVKLNIAVGTLRSFCKAHSSCGDCPFRKESTGKCKFGSFYPELWYGLEIEEEVDNDAESKANRRECAPKRFEKRLS